VGTRPAGNSSMTVTEPLVGEPPTLLTVSV
jgi:hypothetical protein